jgi:hypothetical protein
MKLVDGFYEGWASPAWCWGVLASAGIVPLTARVAYAQAPAVNSIVVQGNQRVEADTIVLFPAGRAAGSIIPDR